jgi:hypothetical protein
MPDEQEDRHTDHKFFGSIKICLPKEEWPARFRHAGHLGGLFGID